jgi:hypothetical protein
MTAPAPRNLGLLVPFLDTEEKKQDVRPLFDGETDVLKNILTLSKHWRLLIKFDAPVRVQLNRRRSIEVTEHVFHGFFWSKVNGRLCYATRRPHRIGFTFHWLHNVVSYEPVLDTQTKDKFKSYEQFQARFDRRYITEEEIKSLWSQPSSLHGKQLRPSDFRSFSKIGKKLMGDFDGSFLGVGQVPTTDDTRYRGGDNGKFQLMCRHYTNDDVGDSYIEHLTNMRFVLYSLCHPRGTKRGKYGVLATKNTYLQLGIG